MLVTRVFSSLLFLVAKYQNARERVPIKVHFQVRTFDAHAYLATAKLEFELKTRRECAICLRSNVLKRTPPQVNFYK